MQAVAGQLHNPVVQIRQIAPVAIFTSHVAGGPYPGKRNPVECDQRSPTST